MSMTEGPPLARDLLVGAEAIADFIGKDARSVYYLASKGQLPTFKLGAVLHARRSTLIRFITDREAAALDSAK